MLHELAIFSPLESEVLAMRAKREGIEKRI